MKKRRYQRLFAVLTAAMFSACNVSTALAMPLQELTGRLSGVQYKAG